MTFARLLVVPVILVVALAGCAGRDVPAAAPPASVPEVTESSEIPSLTPTPTPTPTANDTTLTSVGLGDLVMGKPIPENTKLVEWGDFCGYGTEQWHAPGAKIDDLGAIGVKPVDWERTGPLEGIWVWTDAISTPEGIHEGSTRAELESAYPGITAEPGTGTTDLYVIRGEATNLVFEVLRPGMKISADSPFVDDTVVWMYLRAATAEVKTIDGTGAPASCD